MKMMIIFSMKNMLSTENSFQRAKRLVKCFTMMLRNGS